MVNYIKKIYRLLSYDSNWNIGFVEQDSDEFVHNQKFNKIEWMKHNFRDRWFADPFILEETADYLRVLVEEYPFDKRKGIIVELLVDRRTKKLLERKLLLELNTHLSYPAIFKYEGKVYVYPENGQSGELNMYEYDADSKSLINPVCVLKEAVADASIMKFNDKFYLVATKYPNTQKDCYLYCSDSLFGPFYSVSNEPLQTLIDRSRPAGNWIVIKDNVYRPAQNCKKNYGNGLSIMKVDVNKHTDELLFQYYPNSFRYNLGFHTVNFLNNTAVVDGCGYSFPVIGRLLKCLSRK